jgi:hypothetical protein
MWVGKLLDGYDEKQAAEDDDTKPFAPLVVGGSLVSAEINQGGSLTELAEWVERHKAKSAEFFTGEHNRIVDYTFKDDVLTFRSDIVTETELNDIVCARIYAAKNSRSAVIVLPHWNASAWDYHGFAKQLARLGLTTVELTLPYHGCRNRSDGVISDYFLSANVGRTILSVRQAVLDSRRVIDWLYQRKYEKVGLIGVSLGSCVAGLVAAHDIRISASALLLTAGDFTEVVWTGRATRHIRTALASGATLEQLQKVWSIISTGTFASELSRRTHRCLIISGNRDQVVLPYLTRRFVDQLRGAGGCYAWHGFGCGHYSLGLFPFNIMCFFKLVNFFRREGFMSWVKL